MEEVITGDNIEIVHERARIKKKKKKLCILDMEENNYSGVDMPL